MSSELPPSQRPAPAGPSANFLLITLIFLGTGAAIGSGAVDGSGAAFVFVMAGWLLSLCLHEFAHALVAWKGGDAEIPQSGYLTLDPRLYADALSSIVLPLLFTILGGIGFPGGRVLVNTHLLRGKAWISAVAAAGPAMNGIVLLVLALLYALAGEESDTLRAVLAVSALFQGTAIILNLIPLPGLDGYGILQPWLPEPLRRFADPVARHVNLILAGLFLFSSAFGPAVFRASLSIIGTLGIAVVDARVGYGLIRLW
ncbi:site-2 protease family protein [Methylobacterium sp. 77]|uniref:site-2 protease family protein n=1 Tax=Methylobacterium sp. 77 TaxID=1101192 RepID=UPI000364F260|nr:site-2 protease family protein [Methylobacterium sp. 77]